jgi:undecaprenyl-diphosphatase
MSLDGLFKVLFLAVVQGIAEFLPISSSGHLVVLDKLHQRFFGGGGTPQENILLNVILHVGTLASILVVYRRDLWELRRKPRLCLAIVLATIPAALVAWKLRSYVKATFDMPLVVACGWTVTAGLLWYSQRLGRRERPLEGLTLADALKIGCFQALALLFRGVSRSGSTIAGGLFTGLQRDAAASFSFLIAIPAIAGAAVVEGAPLFKLLLVRLGVLSIVSGTAAEQPADLVGGYSPLVLVIGAFVSFVVGLTALRWLLRIITQRGLDGFVYYCLTAALLTFAWQGYEAFRAGPADNKAQPASGSSQARMSCSYSLARFPFTSCR